MTNIIVASGAELSLQKQNLLRLIVETDDESLGFTLVSELLKDKYPSTPAVAPRSAVAETPAPSRAEETEYGSTLAFEFASRGFYESRSLYPDPVGVFNIGFNEKTRVWRTPVFETHELLSSMLVGDEVMLASLVIPRGLRATYCDDYERLASILSSITGRYSGSKGKLSPDWIPAGTEFKPEMRSRPDVARDLDRARPVVGIIKRVK